FEEIAFKHHKKKVLGKILRVRNGITAPANEGKDGTPVRFAQIGERLASCFPAGGRIRAGENHAPTRCRKPIGGPAPLGYGFRGHSRPSCPSCDSQASLNAGARTPR